MTMYDSKLHFMLQDAANNAYIRERKKWMVHVPKVVYVPGNDRPHLGCSCGWNDYNNKGGQPNWLPHIRPITWESEFEERRRLGISEDDNPDLIPNARVPFTLDLPRKYNQEETVEKDSKDVFCSYCGRNQEGLMRFDEAMRETRHKEELRKVEQKLEDEKASIRNTRRVIWAFVGLIFLLWLANHFNWF